MRRAPCRSSPDVPLLTWNVTPVRKQRDAVDVADQFNPIARPDQTGEQIGQTLLGVVEETAGLPRAEQLLFMQDHEPIS